MQLIQINNQPKLKRKDLTFNCYYKFSSLSNYLFIFDKDHPNEIIPIINNEKEDINASYKNIVSQALVILQQEFVEICELDNISYSQEYYYDIIPYHKIKSEIMISHTSFNNKVSLAITKESKALVSYILNFSDIHLFHVFDYDQLQCNIYKLHVKTPLALGEINANDTFVFKERYWKQVSINKITFKTVN